ncbi:MAG: sugar ABC transporter substrate-binding protein [Parasporobacterium sp.]|nr:sugar ABC transporter substrate-binding protein [Parasporobacterium sp.]
MALGLVFGLAGCGGNQQAAATSAKSETKTESKAETKEESAAPAAEASGIKLGICLPTRDQYWTTFELGCVAAADAAGIENQVVECKEDISTQISQIETFKNNGFDAVIVGLSSNDSYQEAITAAGDMKVIFFNRMVTDTKCLDGKQTIYVGMAEYDAGYAQGSWLAEYFKDSGKKDLKGMMFMGILGQQSVTDRTQGAKDALADAGYNVEWVFEDTAEWDRAKAMDKFTQFANSGAEFDLVVSNNDEMALGVIEGCTASKIDITFPIVGIDATEVGCNAVKDGTLGMTVNQNPVYQAEVCIECLQDLMAGKTPAVCDDQFVVATEAQAVTVDNVADVLANF